MTFLGAAQRMRSRLSSTSTSATKLWAKLVLLPWLAQTRYVRGLHKDHRAQRRDPGHDPPRSGVPGDLIQPPRLQRVRRESLTGSLQHPRPALAWTAPPLDSTIVTQPLLHQPSSHDPPLLPPAPGQIHVTFGSAATLL